MTDDELRAFWGATESLQAKRKDGIPFGSLLRLLLLTAQRENEVAGMRWVELDLHKGIWTIPASRTKNGKPHIVHLGHLALEILGTIERVPGTELVFSATGMHRPPASRPQRSAWTPPWAQR